MTRRAARGRLRPALAWLALILPALAGCGGSPPSPGSDGEAAAPMVRAWPVMGTLLEVSVWEADSARARGALAAARAAVFRVDTLMSVYKPLSDLSVINRRAGSDTATVVAPETAEVLDAALDAAERSGGAFDPTVGPLVDTWGFYRHEGRTPSRAELDSARALVDWRSIEYEPASRRVRLPRPGMRLDFGAIAKGYAVDAAVAALREAGVGAAMVDLGGNLRVYGRSPRGKAWTLGLRDPRNPERPFAVVTLDSGAVATSGDYEQFFVHEGVLYSHIFDPREGWPSRGVASATAVAPTGMAADAYSTVLFVLGPESGCGVAAEAGVDAVWVRDELPEDSPVPPAAVLVTPGVERRFELRPSADQALAAPAGPVHTCEADGALDNGE